MHVRRSCSLFALLSLPPEAGDSWDQIGRTDGVSVFPTGAAAADGETGKTTGGKGDGEQELARHTFCTGHPVSLCMCMLCMSSRGADPPVECNANTRPSFHPSIKVQLSGQACITGMRGACGCACCPETQCEHDEGESCLTAALIRAVFALNVSCELRIAGYICRCTFPCKERGMGDRDRFLVREQPAAARAS